MRVYVGFIAIIGLILLVGAVNAAPIPDQNSTISSSAEWIVVNHPSTIYVTAINTTSGPISNATVIFSLNSTAMGTLVMADSITDGSGKVNGTFTAGTKSGAVNITATITFDDAGISSTVEKVYTQKIDHDVASSAVYDYKSEVTVNTETPFNITYTDRWNNPIDNRKTDEPHYISLHIGSVNNLAAFDINGTKVTDTTLLLYPQGNISVNVLTDTTGGENIIQIKPFGNIGNTIKTIVGITDAVPFSIAHVVSPEPNVLPADGAINHYFTFVYTLNDKFGNIAKNQTVLVHSSWPGDADMNLGSNEWGQISFHYGPHSTSGNVTITATSLTNASVTCSDEIQFYSTEPVNMVFSGSPETMPSRDANNASVSNLTAKIMDIMGNPVANETVTFSIGAASYDDPASKTTDPMLMDTTAISDSNGFATVVFIPGGFSRNTSDIHYNPTVTGTTQATAMWSNNSQKVQLIWKNYPYLKIMTNINPSVVALNGTITVNISMVGDGWALNGKPADVVIVTDLAGGLGGDGLLASTQDANKAFVKNATNTTYIGLVSFGNAPTIMSANATALYAQQKDPLVPNNKTLFNPYGSVTDWNMRDPALWANTAQASAIILPGAAHYPWSNTIPGDPHYNYFNSYSDATIDHDFVSHQVEMASFPSPGPLQTTISGYHSKGGTNYAAGINAALKLFEKNPHPSHSKTIIIMGDGIPMMAPLAAGSMESYWPSDWYPRSSLGWYDESDVAIAAAEDSANRAKAKGITIYAAGFRLGGQVDNATLLKMVSSPDTFYYTPDATKLKDVMLAIQGKIQTDAGVNTTMGLDFNNVNTSYVNQTPLFEYVYNPPNSTTITWQDGVTNLTDQTAEWNANHQLNFKIGTIKLGQTWHTSFELKAVQTGILDICGNKSKVIFNNGEESTNVTGCTVAVVNNLTNIAMTMPAIQIRDLRVTQLNTTIMDFVPLQWNISYPGTQFANERIFYSQGNSPYNWKQDKLRSITPGNWTETYSWDVRSLPAGTYYILVTGSAPDATEDMATITSGIVVGKAKSAYIRLE